MVKIFVLIAVSFVLFCVYPIAVQSQQPTPGAGEKTNPPQKQSSSQQQKPEPDKRGTEQTPFVVKTIPTPKSQAEAEQERKDHKEKSSQDWWAIWLTAIVALMAFLQAIFLYMGFGATKKAADAARDSADALPILERAYIFVEIRFKKPFKEPVIDHNFCEMVITNHGKTPAIMKFAEGWAKPCENIPQIKIDFKPTPIMPYIETIIASGKFKAIDVNCQTNLTKESLSEIKKGSRLIFIGLIQYDDIFGKHHDTGFCWIYSTTSNKIHFLTHPNNYRT